MKARTVVGRGEHSLLSDPGSELGMGREKENEKIEDNIREKQKRSVNK